MLTNVSTEAELLRAVLLDSPGDHKIADRADSLMASPVTQPHPSGRGFLYGSGGTDVRR
jgi:hypothetical protein